MLKSPSEKLDALLELCEQQSQITLELKEDFILSQQKQSRRDRRQDERHTKNEELINELQASNEKILKILEKIQKRDRLFTTENLFKLINSLGWKGWTILSIAALLLTGVITMEDLHFLWAMMFEKD